MPDTRDRILALIARVRAADARAEAAEARMGTAEARAGLMRDVVEAAWDYTYKPPGHTVLDAAEKLRDAVSAYRAGEAARDA